MKQIINIVEIREQYQIKIVYFYLDGTIVNKSYFQYGTFQMCAIGEYAVGLLNVVKYNGSYSDHIVVESPIHKKQKMHTHISYDDQDYTCAVQILPFPKSQQFCICETFHNSNKLPQFSILTYYDIKQLYQENAYSILRQAMGSKKYVDLYRYVYSKEESQSLCEPVCMDQEGMVGFVAVEGVRVESGKQGVKENIEEGGKQQGQKQKQGKQEFKQNGIEDGCISVGTYSYNKQTKTSSSSKQTYKIHQSSPPTCIQILKLTKLSQTKSLMMYRQFPSKQLHIKMHNKTKPQQSYEIPAYVIEHGHDKNENKMKVEVDCVQVYGSFKQPVVFDRGSHCYRDGNLDKDGNGVCCRVVIVYMHECQQYQHMYIQIKFNKQTSTKQIKYLPNNTILKYQICNNILDTQLITVPFTPHSLNFITVFLITQLFHNINQPVEDDLLDAVYRIVQ